MGKSNRSPIDPAGTKWGHVFLLVGAGVVAAFQVGKAPPVLPAIRMDLGMSLFLAGWIISTFNVIGLLFGSATGAVADAFGHRRLLLCGLLCQAAGSLLGALSQGAILLFATRVMEGIGFLAVAVAAPALIFRITKLKDLHLALSAWSCYLPFGASLIMLLTPPLTSRFGWRGLWIANCLILLVYAFIVRSSTRALYESPALGRVHPRRLWQDIRLASTSTGPLLLAFIFSTYTLQWLSVMGFLPTLFIEDYGIGFGKASVLTAVMVFMNVPGNLVGGWLLKRGIPRWKLIAAASLIMGLCSVGIYNSSVPFVFRYLTCLLFSGSGGLLPASVLGAAPLHAPEPRLVGTVNGLVVQGSNLGSFLGPPALALVVSVTGGWHSAPWLLGSGAIAGVVLAIALARAGIRSERREHAA